MGLLSMSRKKRVSVKVPSPANVAVPAPPGPSLRSPLRWGRLFKLFIVLIVGVALGYASARYLLQDEAGQHYAKLKTEFDVTVAQNQYDLANARSQLDFVRAQLSVEESTRKTLEATLQATQSELGRARDQLAFFDQLLPPGPNGSISVRGLDIEQRGSTLQYRVLLMRNAPSGETFNGLMQFVANGLQQGKAVKIKLEPAQSGVTAVKAGDGAAVVTAAGPNELAVSFEQFQRSGGVLSLPDDFIPKTVTLNILEGQTVRVSRTVNLPPPE